MNTSAAESMPHREFVLSGLRCVSIRARLVAAEIDHIGTALKAGIISPSTAIEWADELVPGCLDFVVSAELPPEQEAAA
jgi:hypothetical protein